MNVLITGGAGYIGSQVLRTLKNLGNLIVIDNLSTGNKWAVPNDAKFYEADIGDSNLLDNILSKHKIDAVVHIAASISVDESVNHPGKYYNNNSFNTLVLLEKCMKYKINKFIFSSTAAVYGQPDSDKISEDTTLNPINPYGNSKMMDEKMIVDFSKSTQGVDIDFKFVILRYFNVAGASVNLSLGQDYKKSNHLVTLAAKTTLGKKDKLLIFGTDYPTPDGTCIRDFIHVEDLANAHLAALNSLDIGQSDIYNCGYGTGFSVLEVINTMKKVSDNQFKVEHVDRRKGDPAKLVANPSKLKDKLNWEPKHNLETICKTAYLWEKKLGSGQSN